MHKRVYPDLVRQVQGEMKEMNYGDDDRRLNFYPVSFKDYVLYFCPTTKDVKLHTWTNTNELSLLNTGTAVAQWLRFCATNRKVSGSIPAGVSGFSIDIILPIALWPWGRLSL